MTSHRIIVPLLLLPGLAATGCDRRDPAAENLIVRAREEVKVAPRSIMRPAIVAEQPAPPPPPPTSFTIPFGAPGAALDDAQRATIDGVAARLAATTDKVVLRGHSDSHGGDRRNRLVSLRRARLVATYLVQKGIARSRMTIVALGEDRPIAPNAQPDGTDDPAGRARNRRVEIEIVPAAPAPPPPVQKNAPIDQ